MKIKVGQLAPDFITEDVLGRKIQISHIKGKKKFLAFLRNTHCPLCNYHVLQISKKANYLQSLGLEIIVFYESKKTMFDGSIFFQETVFKEDKFSVVSDPERKVYDLYKAEISPEKATLEVLTAAGRIPEIEAAAKLGIVGDAIEEGTNPDAIPADFLIDEDGIIQYVHYGEDPGDHIDLTIVENFLK